MDYGVSCLFNKKNASYKKLVWIFGNDFSSIFMSRLNNSKRETVLFQKLFIGTLESSVGCSRTFHRILLSH